MPTLRDINVLAALTVALHDRFEARLQEIGIGTASEAACLANLKGYPGDTVEQVSDALGLTQSGTTRLVNRLELNGLVEKVRGQDRRTVMLTLTARGQHLAEQVLTLREACFATVFENLSERQASTITRAAERALGSLADSGTWADRTCRFCDYEVCPQQTCPVACVDPVGAT